MLKKLSHLLDTYVTPPSESRVPRHRVQSFNKSKVKSSFDFIHLIRDWKEIVGEKLSTHTIPVKNQQGTLYVLSNHSLFASELKYMEPILKKRIFEKFPMLEKDIRTLHFIVNSAHFEEHKNNFSYLNKETQIKIKLPHPFSPEFKEAQKEACILFENIDDEDLKKNFISLYIQNKFCSQH